MKKISRLLLFILIFDLCITGYGSPKYVNAATNPVKLSGTIRFAMHKSESLVEPYISEFMEKNPGVTVEYIHLENYENTISEMIVNGDIPDVFLVPGYITYDKYEEYLEPFGTLDELSVKYNYIDKGIYKNNYVYGIPSFAYMFGLVYSKDVFVKAGITSIPKTTDDFLYACNLIKQHTDAIPFYSNYNDLWATGYWEAFPFVEMNGATGYRFNDYIYKRNPFAPGTSHYQVYKLLYDLIANGYTEELGSGSYAEGTSGLANGKVGAMVLGSWAYKEIQNGATNKDSLGFMPFPSNVDGKQYSTVGVDYCYGVSAKSENKELAKAFVAYMLDESGYALNSGNISILKTDPYAEFINQMNEVILLTESQANDEDYNLYYTLNNGVAPGSTDEIRRIMDSASGKTGEAFDDIMEDWNRKWEANRPKDFVEKDYGYGESQISIDNAKVLLSDLEKSFISENPVWKLGYLKYFAPFSYELSDEKTGLVFEVCNIIETATGVKFEYTGYDTPKDALDALKAGEIDMVAGIADSGESGVIYAKAFYEVLDVYACRADVDITKLAGYVAAVDKGEIDRKQLSLITKLSCPNLKECFRELASGNAEYVISNFSCTDYYTKDLECENIKVIPASTYTTLHFALNDSADSSMVALVNKCMYTVNKERMQVALLNYSTPEPKPLTITRLINANPMFFIAIICTIFSIVILAILAVMAHRKRLSSRLEFETNKFQMLSDMSDEYFFDIDYTKKSWHCDEKFQKDLKYPELSVWPQDMSEEELMEKYSDYKDIFYKYMAVRKDPSEQEKPFELTLPNGEKNWFKMMISIMKDKNGNPLYIVGKITNVQKEIEELEGYQKRAEKDALTGLYNRRGFERQLPKKADNVMFVVADLDNFKSINDSLGHAGGDKVLCLMARQMEESFGKDAIVGRFGGDEFVAFLSGVTRDTVESSLKDFVKNMDFYYDFEENTHKISVSAGCFYSAEETEVKDMFLLADEVLYEKKKEGKNGYLISSER